MEVEPDSSGRWSRGSRPTRRRGACAQILFAGEPARIWYAGAPFKPRHGYNGRHVRLRQAAATRDTAPYPTGRACGGAMMFTAGASERVGLFDEELFAYAEDTDWSLRARRAGLHPIVVPASIVHHAVSASSGRRVVTRDDLLRIAQLARRRRALGTAGVRSGRACGASRLLPPPRLRRLPRSAGRKVSAPCATPGAMSVAAGSGPRETASSSQPLFRRDPGLWLLLHLRPPGNRLGDRHGSCSVCGAETRFVRNSWILPRELARVAPPGFADRESQFCASCGSSRRVRMLADVLLEHYADEARSVAGLVEEERFRLLDIAELNAIGRMHPLLAPLPRLTYAEYPEQDIQALTFPDASFDLVLTSETLEHVPDFRRALTETRRVLRPGGRHVFTVPLDPRLERTRSREGMTPIHHGRGGGPFMLVTRRNDMLAYTDFGLDVPELLARGGFRAGGARLRGGDGLLRSRVVGVARPYTATVRRAGDRP